jgi:PLP dependent protein
MTSISQNIKRLKDELPEGVTLVAVSKFHPVEALQEAYDAGQRVFGESRAQELTGKVKVMPKDIEWHFIGPLQTNKVKEIAPFISMIQSVDSVKLLREVEKQAARQERTIRVLLEIHIAREEAKHGFSADECRALLMDKSLDAMTHVQICGLMGMATNTDDMKRVDEEFQGLHDLFEELKNIRFKDHDSFGILSMGMSHDYHEAVKVGTTMVRVGTSIFGEREY